MGFVPREKSGDAAGAVNHRLHFAGRLSGSRSNFRFFTPAICSAMRTRPRIDFAGLTKRRAKFGNGVAQTPRAAPMTAASSFWLGEAVPEDRAERAVPQCANRKATISRETASIHVRGAGDDPTGSGARDRLAHAGMRAPGLTPVAAVLTSCTGALPACAAAKDRVTAGYLSVGQQTG